MGEGLSDTPMDAPEISFPPDVAEAPEANLEVVEPPEEYTPLPDAETVAPAEAAPPVVESEAGPEVVEVPEPGLEVVDAPEQYVPIDAESVEAEQVIGPEQAEILHSPETIPEKEPGGAARPSFDEPPAGSPTDDSSGGSSSSPPSTSDQPDTLNEGTEETGEPSGEPSADASTDYENQVEHQVEQAAETIQQIEDVVPERWQTLDAPQRLETLQEIEDRMAEIQGRDPMPVTVEELPPNTFGGYDGAKIVVNASHLQSDMPVDEFIDTIVHEGRHAYQDHVINNPSLLADSGLVEAWGHNRDHYLNAEDYGQELYAAQPVEEDAARFATQVRGALIADNPRGR